MKQTRKTPFTLPGRTAGFSLIELLIALAIIGILSSIAIPSYNQYVLRGKRAEGRNLLMDAAAVQERYYSNCNKYGSAGSANNCKTGTIAIATKSETGKYNLRVQIVSNSKNQRYLLIAQPTFPDPACNVLTLSTAGNRGIANGDGSISSADCWGR